METSDLRFFRNWFSAYTEKFHSSDEDIEEMLMIKLAHSYRVSENCRNIGIDLGLAENELLVAETIGLLHDVGRFEQSVRYGTMHDARSQNHAALEKENILLNLNEGEQEIILTAIHLHNVKELPKIPDKKTSFFARLIRDADKLDILGVVTNYYEERMEKRNPIIELDLKNSPEYSRIIIENILEEKVCDSRDMRTLNDFKLFQLSWVFDINFLSTLGRISENRYFERILAELPDNREIRNAYSHIQKDIERRLSE